MEGLYKDPAHLTPYQHQDVQTLLRLRNGVLGWDTGMGKSRGLLAVACALLDRDDIDHVLLVCEANKLGPDEWEGDIAALTGATYARYHGPGRHSLLDGPLPQILLTTYETARADIWDAEGTGDGPLTATLADRRVLVAFDEMPKLADHTSGVHQAQRYLLGRLRDPLVVGLTASAYTRDWDSIYNQYSLICPDAMPNREQFEQLCVLRRSIRTGRATFNERAVQEHLLGPLQPYLLRRRKTDPEVRHLFPRMRELTRRTVMTPVQAHLYWLVEQLGRGHRPVPGLDGVLRMLAGYPEGLLGMNGDLVAMIREKYGEDRLKAIVPGKLPMLRSLVEHSVAEGRKTVIFSFFGPTILPLLARDLADVGAPSFLHYGGGMTAAARAKALADFRSTDGPALLLSSDAGARGINLPEASRLIEYEAARTYSDGLQRRNRIHRLNSPHKEVVCATLIADGTIEDRIVDKMLHRNADTDHLHGDAGANGFVTAGDRRAQMTRGRVPATV